eukprot:gb/GEZN01003355.1/.p1 GENE.gb/GEZN01003355.1/~~gb/GEZN01003355.1/.p1  ORF type:complete len:403 (-),score=36.62 gb/GEZN01003355.1/:948-2156(-)
MFSTEFVFTGKSTRWLGRKVLRDSVEGATKARIRRLARCGGIKPLIRFPNAKTTQKKHRSRSRPVPASRKSKISLAKAGLERSRELRTRRNINYAEPEDEVPGLSSDDNQSRQEESSSSDSDSSSDSNVSSDDEIIPTLKTTKKKEEPKRATSFSAAHCERGDCLGRHRYQFSFFNSLLEDRHEARGGLGVDLSSAYFWGADYDNELIHLDANQLERLNTLYRRKGQARKLMQTHERFGDEVWLETIRKLPEWERRQVTSTLEPFLSENRVPLARGDVVVDSDEELLTCGSRVYCLPTSDDSLILRVAVPVQRRPKKSTLEKKNADDIASSYALKLKEEQSELQQKKSAPVVLPPGYAIPLKPMYRNDAVQEIIKKRKPSGFGLVKMSGGKRNAKLKLIRKS